jgi:hypothetical protein
MRPIPETPLSLDTAGVPRSTASVAAHPRSVAFRRRLLALLLGAAVPSFAAACLDDKSADDDESEGEDDDESGQYEDDDDGYYSYGYDCPDYEPVELTRGMAMPADAEQCPAEPEVEELMGPAQAGYYEGYNYYDCGGVEFVDEQSDICTYTLTCMPWNCCGYGRPYLDADGLAVASGATESPAWSAPSDQGADDLTAPERDAIRDFWLKNAAAEHSSVAGFHRFALDLLAHGAPPELVRRAGEGAAQEITHSIDCFSLASRFAGVRMGPEALPLGAAAPVARTLAELAAWTVRDGVVGETLAAYLAAEALEQATDPEVRRTLEIVVRDETAHAELAWETVLWAMDVGGREVRDAVQAVFNTVTYPQTAPALDTPATRAHGLLSAAQSDAAARCCIDEVLRPVMASVLARGLAA